MALCDLLERRHEVLAGLRVILNDQDMRALRKS